MLLEEDDYYVKLVEVCKYTLVGKFTNTMPKNGVSNEKFQTLNSTNKECEYHTLQC